MRISYDPAKNQRNIAERGLPFELVKELEWETAQTQEDTRRDYGERRLRVLALLGDRLHMAVVTQRGDALHVISLRKAHRKEVARYEKQQ